MIRKKSFIDHLFRSVFSVASSLVILGLLVSIAMKSYSNVPQMVTVAGVLSEADPVIAEIYTFYALNGRWPNEENDLAMLQDDVYLNGETGEYSLEKGSLHVVIRSHLNELNGKVLSLRKAVFPNQPDASTLWLCGYQDVPSGMVVDVANRTNIDKKYMTTRCK